MSDFPALTELGVNNPDQILRYSLQTSNNKDVLRIVYKRQKGSLLPVSKKYHFGRAQKMVVTDSGSNKTEIYHEISPFVNKLTGELNQILKAQQLKEDPKEMLKDEIRRLEEETRTRIAYLKQLVEKLS